MKLVGCIMAHGDRDAQATFDRHLPFWRAHDVPLHVACPADSMVKTDLPMFTVGHRSHHNAMANLRFRAILHWLAEDVPSDWYFINEYDSLCLEPIIPQTLLGHLHLWGNVFPNNDSNFAGSFYIHPPLLMDRATLERICAAAEGVSDMAEHGFWDRWLGLVCERGGITAKGFGEFGFSRNTIEPWLIAEAVAAVKAGAVMIHGIKTKPVLDALQEAV